VNTTEYIQKVKTEITEVEPRQLKEELALTTAPFIIDVREQDELAGGLLEDAHHLSRGFLESRIEGLVNREENIVLYCASGLRSALAAKTLSELGYERVRSLRGGITAWKDQGYEVKTPVLLSSSQRLRYSRQILLPEVGPDGQQKLLSAKVLVVGAGGLGSPVLLYLAAAGIGELGIVDDDRVDLSNLQRQIAHTTESVGSLKTTSAKERIQAINPEVLVHEYQTRLDNDNVLEILEDYDLIIDGTDNFPTRYLLNDASFRLHIPVISAAILGFEAQLSVYAPGDNHPLSGLPSPCYRCIFPTPPPAELAPSCAANGVLGLLPGTIGLLQATEAIKLLLEIGDPVIGRLLLYDALDQTLSEVKLRKDPNCPICSRDPNSISAEELGVFPDYQAFCSIS
jgi:sulfur-carrier protein adenylyltransferase/sulfurtransferase